MKKMYEYDCTRCAKHMLLPVELDKSRPIYCETCIEVVRAERKAGKPQPPFKPAPTVASGPPADAKLPEDKPTTDVKSPSPVGPIHELAKTEPPKPETPKITETEVVQKPVGAAVSLSALKEKAPVSNNTPSAPVTPKPVTPTTPNPPSGRGENTGEAERRRRRRRRGGGGGSAGATGGRPPTATTSTPPKTAKPAGGDELFPW